MRDAAGSGRNAPSVIPPTVDEARCPASASAWRSAETISPTALVQQAFDTLAGSAEIAPCVARTLLAHFGADPAQGQGDAQRRVRVEDLSNPLDLTDAERSLLRRLSGGFRVVEIARADGVRPRELTRRMRQICHKLLWQLRAGNLRLQTDWGGI